MKHVRWLMIAVGCCLALAAVHGMARGQESPPAKVNGLQPAAATQSAALPAETTRAQKSEEKQTQTSEAQKSTESGSKAGEQKSEAAAASTQAAQGEKEAPKFHTVGRERLRIEVVLDGVFEAQRSRKIALDAKQWTTFTVLKAVEHGARVERGDVLVEFDPEKIDQAIEDLRRELAVGELEIELAEQQLAVLEKTTPMDLEAAERARRIAREDFEYYQRIGRPMAIKSEEFSLKSARQYLENQEEELRQLEKMYEADDLTEETEKIVLKRARFAVERARFSYEQAKNAYEQAMRYQIPRRDESIEDQTARAELAWQSARVSLPVNLRKQRLALEQLKETQRRSEEKLKKLLADRELMTIRSPIDGVVYYGESQRGKFSDSATLADDLRPGGTVTARSVILTVVQPRPMFVRVTVPEGKLHLLKPGVRGIVEPAANPALKLRAQVEEVGTVPLKPGSFDGRVRVKLGEDAAALMPGMACKVKLVAYDNKRALVVPASAIASDPDNPAKQYVYVLGKHDNPKRRNVVVGQRSGTRAEILEGLCEGERILLQPPKEKP